MELLRSLAALAEPPGPESERLAALLELPESPSDWQYTALFVEQLYPYASVYLGAEGMMGGEARDRIAGFWRALGETPPTEPDHLVVLLALQARLADLSREAPGERERAAFDRARAALLWEHLLSWLPPWLDALDRLGPPGYVAWGGLLTEALEAEASELSLPPDLPAHLREAPGFPDPEAEGGEALLGALLAPVRSGFILTRTDLASCATDLGIGLRAGERRYVLGALLGQDPAAVLGWLAGHARRAAGRELSAPPAISTFWREAALRAASRLEGAAALAG